MTEVELSQLLLRLGEHLTTVLFFATLLFVLLKDKQAALMSGITCLFFLLGTSYFPYLIAWDEQRLYRYPIWMVHELSWMAVIAYLGIKDHIRLWQSVYGQLLAIPLVLINFFRAIDVQVLELMITTRIYQSIYPVAELLIVILCLLPIITCLKSKISTLKARKKSDLYYT